MSVGCVTCHSCLVVGAECRPFLAWPYQTCWSSVECAGEKKKKVKNECDGDGLVA